MSANPKSASPQASMQEQWDTSLLGGANSPWLESLYEQYLVDPNSLDESWRDYFAALPMVAENSREVAHSEIRRQFEDLIKRGSAVRPAASGSSAGGTAAELKQIYVPN